jgi:UDP-glucose 4-epimerase
VKDKKIMITGAAGFIGSNLVESLVKENNVLGIDNLSSGSEDNIREFYSSKNFTFKKIDVKDKDKMKRTMDGIDIIFHLSANADVRRGFDDPAIDFRENALATHNVLECMRETDVRELVFASTSAVYGNAGIIPTPETYGPLKPISHYGASKLAAEAFIFSFSSNYDFKSSVFRFANVVGKRGTHGVIFDFIEKLKKNGKTLEVLGDGTQSKSYIYVEDCVRGMTELHGKGDGLFNLGTKERTSVSQIANLVISSHSPNAKIRYVGGPGGAGWKGDVKVMQLDVAKAFRNGWRYKLESTESVETAIEEIGASL